MTFMAVPLVIAVAVSTGASAFTERTLDKPCYDGIVSAPPSPSIRSGFCSNTSRRCAVASIECSFRTRARFEAAPSMNVSFDVANDSSVSFTNIVIQVRILKNPIPSSPTSVSTVLAGPFSIRTKIVVERAFTINYQIRLRNLSSDCDCNAHVEIVSYRQAPSR
jgi:hypothetical protein